MRRGRREEKEMGRRRVELKRIDDKATRQVTFSKRRSGLMKKAHEICVLCDCQVALLLFSPKGKIYEYSTDSNMENILQRYRRHSFVENGRPAAEDSGPQVNWRHECMELKADIEALQRRQRHLMGEELESFGHRDLQQLEQQHDATLKLIRSMKNQLMVDAVAELVKQENSLEEQNSILESQLVEEQKHKAFATLLSSLPSPSSQRDVLLPDSNIRTYQAIATPQEEEPPPNSLAWNSLPPWMLSRGNFQTRPLF